MLEALRSTLLNSTADPIRSSEEKKKKKNGTIFLVFRKKLGALKVRSEERLLMRTHRRKEKHEGVECLNQAMK